MLTVSGSCSAERRERVQDQVPADLDEPPADLPDLHRVGPGPGVDVQVLVPGPVPDLRVADPDVVAPPPVRRCMAPVVRTPFTSITSASLVFG